MNRRSARVVTGFFNSPLVHFMRNLLAHAGRQGRRVVSAFVATAFAQDDAEAASAQWRLIADQLRPKAPSSPIECRSGLLTNAIEGRAHTCQCRAPHGTSTGVNIHEPHACGNLRPTFE